MPMKIQQTRRHVGRASLVLPAALLVAVTSLSTAEEAKNAKDDPSPDLQQALTSAAQEVA